MSIYSRDYMRDGKSSGGMGSPKNWSAVTWLLVINAAVFIIQHVLFYSPARNVLALSVSSVKSLWLWTFLTYQFSHGNLWHFLGNSLGLFFVGRFLLQMIGSRHFVRIYLLGGFLGGILELVSCLVFRVDAPILGASGSVLAIVFALAAMIPDQKFQMLLLPVQLTIKHFAIIILVINALGFLMSLATVNQSGERTAYMAHFGGMLLGWAYIKHWYPRAKEPSTGRQRKKSIKKKFGIRIIRDAQASASAPTEEGAGKKKPFVTSDVDAILDKINSDGFQSLTEEERKLLDKSSKSLSKRIDRDS
tara:strand:+ start:1156 stop:2070 length:915 start_codon:yes stop_codon:yes gene_type:complete